MASTIKFCMYDDEKQKMISLEAFDQIEDCKKGFKTKRGKLNGIYTYNGKKIIEGEFEIRVNALALVTIDSAGKCQIYDWCGKRILEDKFDDIICEYNRFTGVDKENKKNYVYDYNGNKLI